MLAAVCACTATAADSEPLKLVFKTIGGSTYGFTAENLQMEITDGKLNVQNSAEEHSFLLSELDKMYFDDGKGTGVASISFAMPVKVYSIDGNAIGEFSNAQQACSVLPGGIYIFKTVNSTYKMQVR